MIVHGTKDKIVDMEYSKRAYDLYLENKGKKDEPRVVSFLPIEEGRAGRYINKSSKIKAFRDSVKAKSPLLNQPAQNSIDLTEFSGYNDFKVIYLLGMFFISSHRCIKRRLWLWTQK